jgi:ABC-type transport system involved in multi-copper enzyme maturation permease subunit
MMLAAYAGLSLPPAWWLTVWSWNQFGGIAGFGAAYASNALEAVLASMLFLWGTFHIVLPLPALIACVGLRWKSSWGRELGLALGGILLLLLPFGTLLGMILLVTLLDPRVAEHFSGGE